VCISVRHYIIWIHKAVVDTITFLLPVLCVLHLFQLVGDNALLFMVLLQTSCINFH